MGFFKKKKNKLQQNIRYRLSDECIDYLRQLGYKKLEDNDLADLLLKLLNIDGDLGNIENRTDDQQRELDLEYKLSNELDCASDNELELDYEYINFMLAKTDN